MRFVKLFLVAFTVVLALDVVWWFANYHLMPPRFIDGTMWNEGRTIFFFLDPTVVLPWFAIGSLVAVTGWIRVRSFVPGLIVALGALVGTVTSLAFWVYGMFTGDCQCEGN